MKWSKASLHLQRKVITVIDLLVINSQATNSSAKLLHPCTTAAQAGKVMSEERMNEYHRALTKFAVKGLNSYSRVTETHFQYIYSNSLCMKIICLKCSLKWGTKIIENNQVAF